MLRHNVLHIFNLKKEREKKSEREREKRNKHQKKQEEKVKRYLAGTRLQTIGRQIVRDKMRKEK